MKVGVLGGGQLGRMLALAGIPLGFTFRFLDLDSSAPAGQFCPLICGDYNNDIHLDQFASGMDAVTFEFENVPAEAIRRIARHVQVYPSADALEIAQDRLREKQLFRDLGIGAALFIPLHQPSDLYTALEQTGYPAVLKTRRFGYDGKGQWVIADAEAAAACMSELPLEPDSLILEGFVKFDREVSMIGARGYNGEMVFYPLVENHHHGGILRSSIALAPGISDGLQELAQQYVTRIAEALSYVGVLTVEFFQCDDSLIANEIAPRVHNSGHWTIEGAETSQFENHLRAVLGLPLGATAMRGMSAMWNLIGTLPRSEDVLAVPGAHLHLYGKAPRAGRKIGHVTVCSRDEAFLLNQLAQIRELAPHS